MTYLILGLILFLGAHSVRIVAEDWRSRRLAQLGPGGWKGLYSVVSGLGLVLLIWGFGQARQAPVALWFPPVGLRHLASLMMLASMVLLAAAYVPANRIKARLHHPMVLGVKLWALAHLLANGNLAHVLLFGSFLVWAVLDFRAARARDRRQQTAYPAGTPGATLLTLAIGLLAWLVLAFGLHGWLIGVRPLG
ncbi:MAG: protein NrnU [Rhodoferax sp.]|nr:protein NrnU [Rhodoferax sp.]